MHNIFVHLVFFLNELFQGKTKASYSLLPADTNFNTYKQQ